jgi:hypothetical protein
VLNLVTIVLVIAGLQPLLRKHWPSAGAAMLGLVCFGTYFAASKWIERRNPTELATGRAFPELFAGIALGALLFSAVMIVLRMAQASTVWTAGGRPTTLQADFFSL